MQQEEEAKTTQNNGNNGNQQKSNNPNSQQNNSHHINKWKQETGDDQYGEYIDMDMEEDCVSDVESES